MTIFLRKECLNWVKHWNLSVLSRRLISNSLRKHSNLTQAYVNSCSKVGNVGVCSLSKSLERLSSLQNLTINIREYKYDLMRKWITKIRCGKIHDIVLHSLSRTLKKRSSLQTMNLDFNEQVAKKLKYSKILGVYWYRYWEFQWRTQISYPLKKHKIKDVWVTNKIRQNLWFLSSGDEATGTAIHGLFQVLETLSSLENLYLNFSE